VAEQLTGAHILFVVSVSLVKEMLEALQLK
jgi:hypothetical protein